MTRNLSEKDFQSPAINKGDAQRLGASCVLIAALVLLVLACISYGVYASGG